MLQKYDYEKLFGILASRNPQSIIAERNCIPYLLKKAETFYVVQPNGACHPTRDVLHEFNGVWRGTEFDRKDYLSALEAAATTNAAVTSEEAAESPYCVSRQVGPPFLPPG